MQLPKHSTCAAPRARSGFTLVELMVVIAIIGVVAALATSAALQVVTRQKANNTELTIRKVSDALQAHWKAVVDQANKEAIPSNILYGDGTMQGLIAMAGNDPNNPECVRRARVIWIKLRLKQQFPMNFLEALTPTPSAIKDSPSGKPYVLLAPATVFVQALTGKATLEPQFYESSVCLLLALSQARKGVAAFNQDRLASTEQADFDGLKAIVDAWGRPLVFYRWPMSWFDGEVAANNPNPKQKELELIAKGLVPGKRITFQNAPINFDPVDPDGLLMTPDRPPVAGWNTKDNYAKRQAVWAFEKLCHPVHSPLPVSDTNGTLVHTPVSYYTLPVVASAGPVAGEKDDVPKQPYLTIYRMMGLPYPKEGQAPWVGVLPPALLPDKMALVTEDPSNPVLPHSQDNIYSFRMRLGARGD